MQGEEITGRRNYREKNLQGEDRKSATEQELLSVPQKSTGESLSFDDEQLFTRARTLLESTDLPLRWNQIAWFEAELNVTDETPVRSMAKSIASLLASSFPR